MIFVYRALGCHRNLPLYLLGHHNSTSGLRFVRSLRLVSAVCGMARQRGLFCAGTHAQTSTESLPKFPQMFVMRKSLPSSNLGRFGPSLIASRMGLHHSSNVPCSLLSQLVTPPHTPTANKGIYKNQCTQHHTGDIRNCTPPVSPKQIWVNPSVPFCTNRLNTRPIKVSSARWGPRGSPVRKTKQRSKLH